MDLKGLLPENNSRQYIHLGQLTELLCADTGAYCITGSGGNPCNRD